MTKSELTNADPRVEQSRRIICEATLSEFAAHGFDGTTIEGIAARAGVGKSTIYRHWTSRSELIESAIRTLPVAVPPPGGPSGDDLRQYLIGHLCALETTLHTEPWRSVLPAMIHAAERFPEVRDIQLRFGDENRAALRNVLSEALDNDQLPPGVDLDVLVRTLVAPLFLARLMQHERLGEAMIERIVAANVPPAATTTS